MHTLHLLRSVNHGCETYAARADRLIELRVGRSGHDIRTYRKSREGLRDDPFDELEGFSVDIHRLGIVVGMYDLCLKTVLCGEGFDEFQTLLLALMRYKAHICAERCLLRDDIIRVRTGLHSKGNRCLQHCPRLGADFSEYILHYRPEQPEVANDQLQTEGRIGRQPREHSADLGQKSALERSVSFHLVDKGRKTRDRRILSRGARMSAGGARGKFHVGLTFFEYPDHGKVAFYAADGLGYNAAALVAHDKQLHATAFEFPDDFGRTVARPLLGAGGSEIYVAVGDIALCEQLLDCLKKGHDRALGIGCAAAPDLSVGNVSRERRVYPFAVCRHYVLMAHEQYRLLAALSLPVIQKVAFNNGELQLLMHQRKQLPEHLVEGEELLRLVHVRM